MPRKPNLRRPLFVTALLASALATAQVPSNPPPNVTGNGQGPAAPVRLGDPLAGLTPDQLAAFLAGRDEFTNVETPETGLGPIFNGASCVQCHNVPAPGGGSTTRVTRFGRVVNGIFDALVELGGSLLQRFAIDPALVERVPPEANVVAERISTPLFGAGLIEAIPDAAILANARRPQSDGISGRAALVQDVASGQQRVGRFGWKAQQATLLAFAGDAYNNEMGITNRFFPEENAPNGLRDLIAAHIDVAHPEDAIDPLTGRSDIDIAADFMRLLAPPPRLALSPSAAAGERLFGEIGCGGCHLPTMQTGPSPVAALDRKSVALYSDLLLHDMGALGDGIAQGAAGMREMRTAPLWGLRVRSLFLHDGRATTVDAAIRAHDGEAARARNRYQALTAGQQRQLRDFLGTL